MSNGPALLVKTVDIEPQSSDSQHLSQQITGSLSTDRARFLPCSGYGASHSPRHSLLPLLPLHKTLPLPLANYSHMPGTSHGMPHIFLAPAQARCVPPCHRLIVNTMRIVVPLLFLVLQPVPLFASTYLFIKFAVWRPAAVYGAGGNAAPLFA